LAGRIPYESDKKVVEAAKAALGEIDQDIQLQIAFSTLGNDGDLLIFDDLTHEPDYEKSWRRWKAFHPALAEQLLRNFAAPEELISLIEDFESRARERGFYPNWGPLVGGLVSSSATFADAAIERCFAPEETALDRVFGAILHHCQTSEQGTKDEWMARAVQSPKEEMQKAALWSLRWQDEAPGDLTLEAIRELLGGDRAKSRKLVIETLSDAMGSHGSWAVELIGAIPFADIGEDDLKHIAAGMVKGERYGDLRVGFRELRLILERMVKLESIWDDAYQGLLRIVGRQSPGELYRFIRRRIKTLEEKLANGEKHPPYSPTPRYLLKSHWSIPDLSERPEYPDYVDELAAEIRKLDSPTVYYWHDLFQAAVLLPDPDQGISVLSEWLDETSDPETAETIAELFNVTGSAIVFHQPAFLQKLLERTEGFDLESKQRIKRRLIPTSNGRAYSNGELDEAYHWVLKEARKAASKHADIRVLKAFFGDVIQREERDRERSRELFQNEMLEAG